MANGPTIETAIAELERHRAYFKKHYPRFIEQKKITPYERDHRNAVNSSLLQLLYFAKGAGCEDVPALINKLMQKF